MKLPKGITFSTNMKSSDADPGHVMVNIKIAPWYMPVFMVKSLRSHKIPLWLWPIAFYRYYTRKVKR